MKGPTCWILKILFQYIQNNNAGITCIENSINHHEYSSV